MPTYIHTTKKGQRLFINADLGPHCHRCADVGEFLCDFPVSGGASCDRPMCRNHAKQAGENIHYCACHYKQYRQFRLSGGMKKTLSEMHK